MLCWSGLFSLKASVVWFVALASAHIVRDVVMHPRLAAGAHAFLALRLSFPVFAAADDDQY